MAEDTPVISHDEPGRVLVADINKDGAAAAESGIALTESSDEPGTYSGLVTTAATGLHHYVVRSGSEVVAKWEVVLFDITDELEVSELGTALVKFAALYTAGFIYIDTVNGSAGSVPFKNGTSINPCSTWAGALALSDKIGIKRFRVSSKSSISLTQDVEGYYFEGTQYTLTTNGFSLMGTTIRGAEFTMSVGSTDIQQTVLIDCTIYKLNLTAGVFLKCENCLFMPSNTSTVKKDLYIHGGILTLSTSGSSHIFDFDNNSAGDIVFNGVSGAFRLSKMVFGNSVRVFGDGNCRIVIDSDCVDGEIEIVGGLVEIIDNVVGGFAGTITRTTPEVDVIKINGSSGAAQTLQEVHEDVDRLTVINAGTLPATTTVFETNGTDTADNTFKGKTGTWYNASGAPANKGSFFILSSLGTFANPAGVKITLDSARPLSVAPANGDVFVVLGARSN